MPGKIELVPSGVYYIFFFFPLAMQRVESFLKELGPSVASDL